MKIVYCTDSICYPGGIQTVTITKANALSKIEGNEVWIIVTDNKREPIENIEKNVHLIDLDINYYEDDYKSKWHILKGIFIKRKHHKNKLRNILNDIGPDIIVSTGTSEKFFLPNIKINSNPQFIREIHFTRNYRSLNARNLFEKISAKIGDFIDYKLSINRYNSIVVLTEQDKNENWENNKKIIAIPNPIKSLPYKTSTIENKKVIAAGRLTHQKNFASLIRSWNSVVNNHPDWSLEIYGNGAEYNNLLTLISNLKLEKHVFLKGHSYNILEEMANASIFTLTSTFEGFGLVIVEAMSCGLPVISYNCPCGPKDIISDGTDGFLVPLNDEQCLAEKINLLIENEALRKQMSKAALIKSQKFTAKEVISIWMNLFNTLKNEK